VNAEVSSLSAEYDLTICEVSGPQGEQGKLGDTGAQGVQGKLGDTGAQGVQGKLGDTGAQGVQGKLGDTGAQGVQGKLGDTGAQGDQGKIGETGAQGVQGKLGGQGVQGKLGDTGATGATGATGDQGVQGKIGETGAQGPTGPQGEQGDPADPPAGIGLDRILLAVSSDQTIGTAGIKFIGLGDTAGFHDDVAIPLPYGGSITDIVARTEAAFLSDTNKIRFEVWVQNTEGDPPEFTGLYCEVTQATFNGKGCIATRIPGTHAFSPLDSVSVRVINGPNQIPTNGTDWDGISTDVSVTIGIASD
jgi:hypothetical protein